MKKAPQKLEAVFGPRVLCLFRGASRPTYAVVWLEYLKSAGPIKAVHALFTESTNGGIEYYKGPASDAQYIGPTSVKTTANQYWEYMKRRLLLYGGPSEAYYFLGVQKPILVQANKPTATPESLLELYSRSARLLNVAVEELQDKYKHLNNGLQAMVLRNRLRSKGHNV